MKSSKTYAEEDEFRESYAGQLRGKKQQVYDTDMGQNALEEERMQVNQQAMKTPGRRGENNQKRGNRQRNFQALL